MRSNSDQPKVFASNEYQNAFQVMMQRLLFLGHLDFEFFSSFACISSVPWGAAQHWISAELLFFFPEDTQQLKSMMQAKKPQQQSDCYLQETPVV